jgi:hypothetical protein
MLLVIKWLAHKISPISSLENIRGQSIGPIPPINNQKLQMTMFIHGCRSFVLAAEAVVLMTVEVTAAQDTLMAFSHSFSKKAHIFFIFPGVGS